MKPLSSLQRYAVCYLIVITLAAAAYGRNTIWRGDFTLWRDVVFKSGAKARAYYNMGAAYHDEKGFLDKAIENYKIALSVEPNHPGIHNDLGDALRDSGMLEEAIKEYETAVRLMPFYPKTHNNLGVAYLKMGNLQKAVFEFRLAIGQMPGHPEPYYNMALALKDAGKKEEAKIYFKKFIKTASPEYKGMIIEAETNLQELPKNR
mgnify:FL=1